MKLMFVGDINAGEYYTSIGNGPKTFMQKNNPLAYCAKILQSADAVIGNLESPLTNRPILGDNIDQHTLIGDGACLNHFTRHNFKFLQIANNHAVQHGVTTFNETLDILQNHKLTALGLPQQQLTIFTQNDVHIGLLCASSVPDNTVKNQTSYQTLDAAFLQRIKDSIPLVDHLIVLLHWGFEDATTPTAEQKQFAQELKAQGVRCVIGSHTHLFYSVEKQDNFLCAYSLGNFIFDLAWDPRLLKSGILEINFTKSTFSARVHPLQLHHNGCSPRPSGTAVEVDTEVCLYNHGASLRAQQLRKIVYLLSRILQGNTRMKFGFLMRKVLKIKI